MGGLRARRILWGLLAVLAGGAVLFYMARQLTPPEPRLLDRATVTLLRWKEFLERYGLWLHLGAHGATYLYLILRWSQLVHWIDRQRAARGRAPLPAIEQRRLAWAVLTVCVAYEGLLLLRYLD